MEELFGDEFPEAFATNPGGVRAHKKKIWDLPVELLSLTCQYLSGLDIKRLRLASQHFANISISESIACTYPLTKRIWIVYNGLYSTHDTANASGKLCGMTLSSKSTLRWKASAKP